MTSSASRSDPRGAALRIVMRRGGPGVWGLPFLAAAMDAAWITPYALLLGSLWLRPGTPLLRPLSLLALLGVAQALTRRLLAQSAPVGRARRALVPIGAAAVGAAVAWQYGGDPWWRTHGPAWHALDTALAALRPEFPALALAALVWRRGIGIGRTELEYYDVEGIFRLGLGAFGVFAVGMALGHSVASLAAVAAAAFPYLLAFFAAGLIALPVARLRSVRQRTRASPRAVTVSNDWYAVIAAAVAAILAVATIAGALLRLDVGAALYAAGRLLDPLLWALLYVIAVPLGLLISGIIWVIRLVLRPGGPQPPHPFALPEWIDSLPGRHATGLPPDAAAALRWGAGLIILILGLLWLARAVFRYERTGKAPPTEETRESVWSWDDLLAGWRARFRRRPRASVPGGPASGSGAGAVIRRAYAEFLGIAALAGIARASEQTPGEFAGAVGRARPAAARAVDTLTAVYVRVRYGLETPSEGDVARTRGALAEVRARAVDAPGEGTPHAGSR